MRRLDTSRLVAGGKRVRIPVILIVLYLVLHQVLAALSARHGFGSPDGASLGYLGLSVAVVALRLTLLVVMPAILAYRLVAYVISRALRRVTQQD